MGQFHNLNPATGTLIGEAYDAEGATVEAVVQAARRAPKGPGGSATVAIALERRMHGQFEIQGSAGCCSHLRGNEDGCASRCVGLR